jgi:hypothetical protein
MGLMSLMNGKNFAFFLVLAVLLAVFSWAGLAIFGVAILSATLVAALIGLFIPAILVGMGLLIFIGIVPTPSFPIRMIAVGVLMFLAWVIASLPGGGL